MRDEISLILDDRESGSVLLLNRLIDALEKELHRPDLNQVTFSKRVNTIREKLRHFAAVENFLASLILHSATKGDFPGEALQFIADYRLYWADSEGKMARNFLQHCRPAGKTILTHSHSETILSLLIRLHENEIPFRVLQTLSVPGEEGKIAYDRMCRLKIWAELIDDAIVSEAIGRSDFILVGCDALLSKKFLNKTGTRNILEQAKHHNKPSFLISESRKEITRTGWEKGLTELSIFEWVPLELVDNVVTEQ